MVILAAAASLGSAVSAQQINFSGSAGATALVAPNPICAPLPFRGVATGSGTSTFGSFNYSHITCTAGGTGGVQGTSIFDFGADQFTASLLGTAAATSTPGIFNLFLAYDITGGTGRFANATGSFNDVGTVNVQGGPPSRLSFTFSAVPEPQTWEMMLLGFAAVGLAARRQRRFTELEILVCDFGDSWR